jgi:HSP20 family protein
MTDPSRTRRHSNWPMLEHLGRKHWVPAADVYQIPCGWIVKVELAGVREEDVAVAVEGNCLCIQGRRIDRVVDQAERCELLEITYDQFERRIELSPELARCRVITEYRDGMLLVTLVSEESAQ